MLTPSSIKAPLRECGYRPELLRTDFLFGQNQAASLVAFAQAPADSRSACVAVLSASGNPRADVEARRALGAPIVFVCLPDTLQWWKQGTNAAKLLENIPANNIEQFFRSNLDKFSPEAVYRAKTWGRFQQSYQLSFVDTGLMPLVQEQVGRSLGELIERNVAGLKDRLGWEQITDEQGHWLLQTVFWIVSAKILRDKQVQNFGSLELDDVDEVFRRVGNHYGTKALVAGSKRNIEALVKSASIIDQFSSLVLTTTEALAYVYENTLISKETRSDLGTHSTPSFLVDYIVGNMAQWIKEIPVNERSVFEPACGHAAFLVSAMRLLTELLPPEKQVPSRRGPYLRSRMHGTDIDPFALELARLSLTLTDIPNPDGWDLKVEDMFLEDRLVMPAKKNTILLANPPFDNFSPQEKSNYGSELTNGVFFNKASEMLWRTIPNLPEGGVFGVVVPQTILHNKNAAPLRKFLVRECELKEICLFPDKVFSFSGSESAVLIGRRKIVSGTNLVGYRRIRERDLPAFRSDYSVLGARVVCQSRFTTAALVSLRLPELEEVWIACADNPKLADIADLGQGLFYRGKDLPPVSTTYSDQTFSGGCPGFVHFDQGIQLHKLPTPYWMNLDPAVVSRAVSGTKVGIPQVLLNYAPASRGPWRLKALVDRDGHPATNNFILVRPTRTSCSIEVLWALLNSTFANAYAFSHLGKRHNIVGDIRNIPIPKAKSFAGVERAAITYLTAASSATTVEHIDKLLMHVDSEVLKLYALPIELETRLLGLFNGWERLGVPFKQSRFIPEALEGKIRLSDLLQFEANWSATNWERGKLIDKSISGKITASERTRLDTLQSYADYHIQKVSPRPAHLLDALEERLGVQPVKDRGQ